MINLISLYGLLFCVQRSTRAPPPQVSCTFSHEYQPSVPMSHMLLAIAHQAGVSSVCARQHSSNSPPGGTAILRLASILSAALLQTACLYQYRKLIRFIIVNSCHRARQPVKMYFLTGMKIMCLNSFVEHSPRRITQKAGGRSVRSSHFTTLVSIGVAPIGARGGLAPPVFFYESVDIFLSDQLP